ncbi:MAG: hypothetical protein ABI862_18990, partial [Ilumatobacteraceae bacterium]
VNATITLKDFDGDTATASAAIGGNVTFFDDGVDAVLDTAMVPAGTSAAIVGNVLANDMRGADGSSITAVANALNVTDSTVDGNGNYVLAGQYGQLTLNATTGAYTYARTPGAGGGLSDVFTYTLTDNDGDFDTATLTIAIGDKVPVAGTASATVDDDALAGGLAAGSGDLDANAGDLDATSEAIFKGTLGGTPGDGASTFLFAATLGGTTATVGQETVTYSVSPNGTLLTATGPRGVLFTVQITDQATGAYTVTLADNVLHPTLDGLAGDDTENDVDIVVPYHLRDADGDFSVATGSLAINFDDDIPVATTAAAAMGNNAIGASFSASLDTGVGGDVDDNFGADGGAVVFSQASIIALQAQNLSSGLTPLAYSLNTEGTVITATKGMGGAAVFTIALDNPATTDDMYTVTILQKLDSVNTVDFNDGGYNFVGGNGAWAGFTQPAVANSDDVLLTPVTNGVDAGTVNTNANEGGVSDGNSVKSGEAIRVDFVKDLTGSPQNGQDYSNPANQNHAFTAHYSVQSASALITSVSGSTSVKITARDDVDNDNDVGDGNLDPLTAIAISFNGTTSALITASGNYTVGGRIFTVAFSGGSATVTNVGDSTRIAGFTADGFNSIEFAHGGTGSTFKIGDFGAGVVKNNPVPFTVPISVQDGDGDAVASGNLAITLNPTTPPIALDLDGNGVAFTSLAAGTVVDYGNGAVHTAWVGSGDGLLAIDANGDGKASGSEVAFAGGGTDLQGLAAKYDSNHDGKLDAADADFAKFGVWQDADGDGVSDAGEFHTLGEAGIASISLVSDGVAYTAANGDVTVAGSSTYTRADGSTGTVADAAFATAALDKLEAKTLELTAANAAAAGALAAAAAVAALPVAAAEVAPATAANAEAPASASLQTVPETHEALRPVADTLTSHEAAKVPAETASHGDEAPASASNLAATADHATSPVADSADDAAGASPVAAATADFGGDAGQLMDALLAAAQAAKGGVAEAGQHVQDLAAVTEAFGDSHGAALVDALVDRFADGVDHFAGAQLAVPASGDHALAELFASHVGGSDSFGP